MSNRAAQWKSAGLALFLSVASVTACNDNAVGGESWRPAVELHTARDRPEAIAADDTHVYWAEIRVEDDYPNQIYRMLRTGGEPELLHSQLAGIVSVAVDDEGLYFDGSGELLRMDKASLEVTTLSAAAPGEGLVARDGRLFWWSYDHGAVVTRIHTVRNDGSDPQVIGARAGRPTGGIGIDEDRVYWGSQTTGEVLAVSRSADATEADVIAVDQCPHGVAVDDTHVYWHHDDSGCHLTEGTSVRRAPKTGAVADTSLIEEVTESAGWLAQGNDGAYYTNRARLYRAAVPAAPELASYADIGCETQGGIGRCVSPQALHVDSLGAVLAGWAGQDPGNGWIFTIPRR